MQDILSLLFECLLDACRPTQGPVFQIHTWWAVGKSLKVMQENQGATGKSTEELWLLLLPTHLPCKFYLHTQCGKEAASAISTKAPGTTLIQDLTCCFAPWTKGSPRTLTLGLGP